MKSPSIAISALEAWATNYFPGISEKLKHVVAIDIPHIDPNNPWANGQSPLIYQHRDEIEAFIEVLKDYGLHGAALEVGLEHGGLHVMLCEVFKKVISIEISLYKILNFLTHTPVDERSVVIWGDSTHRKTVKAVQDQCGELDFIFIDADHSYNGVSNDYMLYRDLVREGGIIAFHDSAGRHPTHTDIQTFLTRLRNGDIDGLPHKLVDIIKSGTGISYEVVEGKSRWSSAIEYKDMQLQDLHRALGQKEEMIEKLKAKIEMSINQIALLQKESEESSETSRKLTETLANRVEILEALQKELVHIKSSRWFRVIQTIKRLRGRRETEL